MIRRIIAITVLAAVAVAPLDLASAQVARPDVGLVRSAASPVTQVRFRHVGHRGFSHRAFGNRGLGHRRFGGFHGFGGRRFTYRRGHRFPVGAGLAAGLAAGAILGGIAAASRPAYAGSDAEGYCASRFRSYDPASGTYLGYDGVRHRCP